MHKDDLNEIVNLLRGLGWLIRANATTFLVFTLIVLLLPVQLVLWIAGADTFLNTEPYRFLRYAFLKGTAFDWERPIAGMTYQEWKYHSK